MSNIKFDIKRDMPNSRYHYGEDTKDYISSTLLKKYLISPKAFKSAYDNHNIEKETDAFKFGELFHTLMELRVKREVAIYKYIAVFDAPINDKTGLPYGSTTKAYKEAYEAFLEDNIVKIVTDAETFDIATNIVSSLLRKDTQTGVNVNNYINDAVEVETSFFLTEGTCKLKVRPDLLTENCIVDWKTTSLEDLSEYNIANTIIKYGYDVSLSMYQYVLHKIFGKWFTPILVFVQKNEPYDCVVVDITEWCYNHESGFVSMGCGAINFQKILTKHKECLASGKWGGIESQLSDFKCIMKPAIPVWYDNK